MSKTQFKKEISALDREQLIQLLLDLYSARKEAKEYFEFFVNPDTDALFEKFRNAVSKELARGKFNRCTARISRVRAIIKEFASYGVPAEQVVSLMVYAIGITLVTERRRDIPLTLFKGISKLCADVLVYGDKNLVFDTAFKELSGMLNGSVGNRYFVNALRGSLDWSTL